MSNKLVLIFVMLLSVTSLFAQHPFDESLNPLKDILPPAPTAAALGTYGEIPVSLHTGIPNVSVPLTTLSGKSLSVPISLSYHGGGNQVDAISSWVGLGWSLNAGGVITRTVHGIADDAPQFGYWSAPIPNDFLANGISNPATQQEALAADAFYDYLKAAADGNRDGQPDQFNFNINGYSGRFYIERKTENGQSILVPRLVPHQNIKIELERHNGTLVRFVLTTPDGIKYKFGGLDRNGVEVVERSKTEQTGNSCGRNYDLPTITSWYLREIEAPNGTDYIYFDYETHLLRYESGISESITSTSNVYSASATQSPPNCPLGTQASECISHLRVNGIHLKKIEAEGGIIEFVSSNIREDVLQGGARLNEILQYGASNQVNYLKKFVLTQDYALSPNINSNSPQAHRYKRLRLLQVQAIGANNNNSIPPHVFEYEPTALPHRLSKARDFWGYYNGQDNNLTLIPASIPLNDDFHTGGGNRYPNATYGKAGILQKITYPTGGHTSLEYEGHEMGYDVSIPEIVNQSAGAGALHYQQDDIYNSTFTIGYEQDVKVHINVKHKCGTLAPLVSYLKIEKEVTPSNWQPFVPVQTNPNINTSGTGNDGPGTIDFPNANPLDNIDNLNYNFDLTLPVGTYRLTAAALNGPSATGNTYGCTTEDELSIQVEYKEQTGNLIHNEAVGGLRIKRTTIHNGLDASKDIIKEYDYQKSAESIKSSGTAVRALNFEVTNKTYNLIGDNPEPRSIIAYCEVESKTKSSESQIPLHGVSGAHIAYREVTVLDGVNAANGKTWNKFNVVTNTSAALADGLTAPATVLDWQGGNLLQQIVYKNDNGNFVKLSEQLNDYEIASINGNNSMYTFHGLKVGKIGDIGSSINSASYIACDGSNTTPCPSPNLYDPQCPGYYTNYIAPDPAGAVAGNFWAFFIGNIPELIINMLDDNYHYVPTLYIPHPCEGLSNGDYIINYPVFGGFAYTYYPIHSGWNQMVKSTTRQYDENGVDYIETITEYDYDPVFTHLKSTKITNSDGLTHVTKTKYVTDYTTYAGSTDEAALAMNDLKTQYRHSIPVEQSKYIQKAGQSPQLVGGVLTLFKRESNGLVVPQTLLRSKVAAPINNYTESNIDASAGFVYDQSVYEPYGNFLKHDSKGNILDYQRVNDKISSFAWGYNQRLPIASATNAHSSEIAYTGFEEGDEIGWNISSNSTRVGGKVGTFAMQTNEEFPFGRVLSVDGQQKKYKFSAWVKTSDATNSYLVARTCVSGNNATYPNPNTAPSYVQTVFTTTNGDWQLVEVEIDLAAIRQAASLPSSQALEIHAYLWNPHNKTIALDAVRFHPVDAFMKTFDYDKNSQQLTTTEEVSRLHNSYHYDDFQRLSHIKDFEGNIMGTNNYHYKGNGSIENHIKTQVVRTAGKTTLASLVGLPLTELSESYQYIDGLGRAMQIVAKGQSPNQKDIVSFHDFDAYGRESKVYLPFVNSQGNTGGFNANPIQQVQTFYNSEIAVESQTTYPYSETVFDNSPANRAKENSSAGNGWQIGSTHTVKTVYAHNTANEVLDLNAQSATAQYYPAKALIKNEVTNEKGVKTISYTDKLGRTILAKQQLSANTWTSIYTLYTDFGNTKAVITPLAVEMMQQTGNYDYTDVLYKELVYTYQYDAYQRLISKKIPNAGETHYVYDQLDRLVGTQDANQRQLGQWTIQKYDQYGRPIITVLYQNSGARNNLQQYFDGVNILYEEPAANTVGYTNTIPVLGPNDAIQGVNYYDDYDFDNDGQMDYSFIVDNNYPATYFDRTLGQATGSKVRILDGSGQFMHQVNFYDERGRLIQSQNDNQLGGKDNSFSAYDFTGNVTQTKYHHTTNNGGVTNEIITEEFYSYDHTGRLLEVHHKIGDQDKILLKQHQYDELGRLIEKNLHSTNQGSNFLQSIDYYYNAKNWLVRINDLNQVSPNSTTSASSTTVLEKKINEIVLKYNSDDVKDGEVRTEVKIDDETVDLVNGIIVASQQAQTNVDLYGEVNTSKTKDEEVKVDFSDKTVTENNISASLEELETRLQQKLIDNGVTNPTVMEVLLNDLKAQYRDRWLLLRSNVENEDNEDLLKMNFDYDYGGNIKHLEWKVEGYNYRSIYDYTYDNLNRLTNANYTEYLESSTVILPVYQRQNHFSVNNISYDVMGNITGLRRNGTISVTGTTPVNGLMDDLSYTYFNNQVVRVNDASNQAAGFHDQVANKSEYFYDANGNLIQDDNKQIIIQYNHLNLPKQIQFPTSNGNLQFTYNAAGIKLQKQIIDNNTGLITNKYYVGNVQYVNTNIEFINHSEGRIIRNHIGFGKNGELVYDYRYEYTLKDHLGNGRIFFSDTDKDGIVEVAQGGNHNELLQQEHYYPFGMPIRGEWKFVQPQVGGVNKYQYNGKELNDDFGLNWNDYGARWYDASIGRWNGIDPLAENYLPWSGYNYVLGNPLKFIDPDGMRVINGHEREYNEAQNRLSEAQASYNAINDNMSNADVNKIKRQLKKSQQKFNVIEKKYNKAQDKIDLIKDAAPTLHRTIDNLKASNGEDVNVYVYATSDHKLTEEGKEIHGETEYDIKVETFVMTDKDKNTGEVQVLVPKYPGTYETGFKITLYGSARASTLANEYGDVLYGTYNTKEVVKTRGESSTYEEYLKSPSAQYSFQVQEGFEKKLKEYRKSKKSNK